MVVAVDHAALAREVRRGHQPADDGLAIGHEAEICDRVVNGQQTLVALPQRLQVVNPEGTTAQRNGEQQ